MVTAQSQIISNLPENLTSSTGSAEQTAVAYAHLQMESSALPMSSPTFPSASELNSSTNHRWCCTLFKFLAAFPFKSEVA